MNLICREVGERLKREWLQLLAEESGQDLIEYALVAALVALGAIATMKSLGTKIGDAFTYIGTTLTTNT